MIAVYAFWLALFLPGYAALRILDRAALQDGALASIGRSYLATLGLLTPISIAGYLLHLPIMTLSVAIVLLVALSLGLLSRELRVRWRFTWPGPVAVFGTAILLADVALSTRVGTHLGGDAGYHVARARMLLQHGFNNWDPLVAGHGFDHLYHTNLYHALLAACAQLTSVHPGVAWMSAWPWAKVMNAAAIYHLAVSIFRRPWLGWLGAIAATLFVAPYSVLAYPNTLAPNFLLAMGIGFGIEALAGERSFRASVWIGLCALALAQVHMLNALFLLLAVAPALTGKLLYLFARTQPGKRQILASLCALGLCLPWLAIPALPRIQSALRSAPAAAAISSSATPATQATPSAAATPAPTPPLPPPGPHFVRLASGSLMGDPTHLMGTGNRYAHMFVLLLLALLGREKKRVLALLGIVLATSAELFFPPLCTLLVKVAGADWVLWRSTLVFVVVGFALTPGTLFELCEPLAKKLGIPRLLQLAGLVTATLYALRFGVDNGVWTRDKYFAQAKRYSFDYRAHHIEETARFFATHVASGETIGAPPAADYHVAMHCDCFVLAPAPDRGARGLADMAERRQAAYQLFRADTDVSTRLATLRRYRLQHVFAYNRASALNVTRGLRKHVVRIDGLFGAQIVTLNP